MVERLFPLVDWEALTGQVELQSKGRDTCSLGRDTSGPGQGRTQCHKVEFIMDIGNMFGNLKNPAYGRH